MAIQKSVKQSAIVDNNDKKIISLINEIGSQINVFVKASNSIDTVDANINKQKEQLAAEIAAIKAKHGLIIDQEKKEKKLINQLKDDTKKRIDNLITPLRAAKVVIGHKDKKCPYAIALYDAMGTHRDARTAQCVQFLGQRIDLGTRR